MERAVPALDNLTKQIPFFWVNPDRKPVEEARKDIPYGMNDILDAEKVLKGYAPILQSLFPELAVSNGIIESPLLPAKNTAEQLHLSALYLSPGQLFILKRTSGADHALPVSGSIKARGGIYAVLKIVDEIAKEGGFFEEDRMFSLSAAAGIAGIPMNFSGFWNRKEGTHIVWTTGGSMEPDEAFTADYNRGMAGTP